MKTAVVLGAAALAIALGATSSQASTPARIVFAADRAPTVTGEIYRLDPNGRRVDLSRSPYQDTSPAVSTDGKRVAFFSDRGRTWAVYEIGIGGHGLRRLGPAANVQSSGGTLTWQPHGRLVAVSTNGRVWIDASGREPVVVKRRGFLSASWSPDGRVLLLSSQREVDAVAPSGRELWHAAGWGVGHSAAWSPDGLLAISLVPGVAVYDESGHLRLRFGLPTAYPSFLWSPDGRHLAIAWSGPRHQQLEVRTDRGSLVLKKNVGGGDLGWASDFEVVAGIAACSACRAVGADVRTGKVSRTSSRWLDPLSVNRKLAAVTAVDTSGTAFNLGVAAPGGGPMKTYERIGGCFSDGDWTPAASSLQFVGRSRSIVYQSWGYCDSPFSNLYSMAPDGNGLHRLTNVQAQETQPTLSPDGSEIAYVWAEATGLSCRGCSDGIRLASSTGAPIRTLTDPQGCTFDDSPTWSPDGSTILYSESGCDSAPELFTVPAAGGTPRDLGIVGASPAWGPTRIAYDGGDQSDPGLWTANPDGSDQVLVDKHGGLPAWSPSGQLAYLEGTLNRYVVVGSKRVELPFSQVTSLAWSPDGTRLIVTGRAPNTASFDVYSVNPDGTDPVRLTRNYDALGAHWGGS